VVSLREIRGLRMVECGSRLRMSSGWRVAPGWPGIAEATGWTLRVVDFSREALVS